MLHGFGAKKAVVPGLKSQGRATATALTAVLVASVVCLERVGIKWHSLSF
jgi:hypothetical protein